MSAPNPTTAEDHRGRRALPVLLWLLTLGVLTQGALAGLFLSGTGSARFAHLILGWLLPYAGIAVAVVAAVGHARRSSRPGLAIAVYPLPVLLWAQEALGHVPAPATTAIHVPLGVALAVYTAVLAVLAGTTTSLPLHPPPPEEPPATRT